MKGKQAMVILYLSVIIIILETLLLTIYNGVYWIYFGLSFVLILIIIGYSIYPKRRFSERLSVIFLTSILVALIHAFFNYLTYYYHFLWRLALINCTFRNEFIINEYSKPFMDAVLRNFQCLGLGLLLNYIKTKIFQFIKVKKLANLSKSNL